MGVGSGVGVGAGDGIGVGVGSGVGVGAGDGVGAGVGDGAGAGEGVGEGVGDGAEGARFMTLNDLPLNASFLGNKATIPPFPNFFPAPFSL